MPPRMRCSVSVTALDHHHGDVREVVVGAGFELLEHAEPVDAGHHDIEEHGVGYLVVHELECLGAVGRCDNEVARGLEIDLDELSDIGLVVDDEDRLHGCQVTERSR